MVCYPFINRFRVDFMCVYKWLRVCVLHCSASVCLKYTECLCECVDVISVCVGIMNVCVFGL